MLGRGRRTRGPPQRFTPDGQPVTENANPQALVARAAARGIEDPAGEWTNVLLARRERAAAERQRERVRFAVKDPRQRAAVAHTALSAGVGDGLVVV